jgi:hypothetical protein
LYWSVRRLMFAALEHKSELRSQNPLNQAAR